MRAALSIGNVAPAQLGGLQMHGTGTPLGDPIEIGAASAVVKVCLPQPVLSRCLSRPITCSIPSPHNY